jgi:small-conductance mechanosensitive channel
MKIEAIAFVALVIFAYVIGKNNITRLVSRIGRERHIASQRINYVNTVLNLAFTFITVIAAGLIIGSSYDDLGIFFGSIFAFLGVALFAQWSILSNVTSSIIVFFFFPYRVGDYVRILDGENSVAGEIKEISLFHVILISSENTLTTFPNSLVFQRAVIITSNRYPTPTEITHKTNHGPNTNAAGEKKS